jgi:hypothetical protein
MARSTVVLAMLAVAAAVPPLRRTWLCDDAFITFRCVQRALAGEGLTYNPGERVEGFTHFLWAILLWALHVLGIDLETLGRWLPLPFYAASVVVLGLASTRLFGARMQRAWGVPVAALLWAVHHEAHVFASGGLETAAYVFFLVLGFHLMVCGLASPTRGFGPAALAYSLAAITRPEGFLHLLVAGGLLLWRARARPVGTAMAARAPGEDGRRDLACFALVAAALLAPLVVWRWAYYHDFVPNSFYAKSGGRAYWGQGWFYVGLYFRYYAPFLLGLGGAALALVRPARGAGTHGPAILLAAAHAAVAILSTAWVGGDFMFARFLLPATPFLALLAEHAVLVLPRGAGVAALVLAAWVVNGGIWRERTLHGLNVAVRGIADERSQYPAGLLEERRRQGEVLARCCAGTQAVFLVQGAQASYAYYGRFPVAIEAYGLTDRTIARAPLDRRGRPGHERQPPLDYLLRRRTNFLIHLPGARPQRDFARIEFGDLLGEVVVYDRALMDRLRGCGNVRFTDFPAYFDAWLDGAAALDPERLRRDADGFRQYYFDHNSDPERAARLRALSRATAGP